MVRAKVNHIFSIFSVKRRIDESRNKLYRAAYSWCHDRAIAEDLMQETLLKALSSKSSLQEPRFLDTWLYRILINSWHDYLRKQKEFVEFEESQFSSKDDIEGDYQRGEIVTRVRVAVSNLPLALREVISLADLAGFKYQQIADILDIPVGTVMSRLFRARKNLQQALSGLEDQVSGKKVQQREKFRRQATVTELRKVK